MDSTEENEPLETLPKECDHVSTGDSCKDNKNYFHSAPLNDEDNQLVRNNDNNHDASMGRRQDGLIENHPQLFLSGLVLCVLIVAYFSIGGGGGGRGLITNPFQQGMYIFDLKQKQQQEHGRRLQENAAAGETVTISSSGRVADDNNTDTPITIRLIVYSASDAMYNKVEHDVAVGQKQMNDVALASGTSTTGTSVSTISPDIQIESIKYMLSQQEQISFVQDNCGDALPRMQELYEKKPNWAVSIVQWCALSIATRESTSANAVMFIDPGNPLVLRSQERSFNLVSYLKDYVVVEGGTKFLPNMAVLGSASTGMSETIHGSFIILRNTSQNHDLAKRMLKLVLSTEAVFDALESNALLLSQTFYSLIRKRKADWYFLELNCRMQPSQRRQDETHGSDSSTTVQHSKRRSLTSMECPSSAGYCCSVVDRHGAAPVTVLLTRHSMQPYQVLDHDKLMAPYNRVLSSDVVIADEELPYISTVTETIIPKPEIFKRLHTFYELLAAKHCLPADDNCSKCLREKRGASCKSCGSLCHCYCKALCNPDERPHTRPVTKKLIVTPPAYRRDPTRIIPRIVHQTWFEELTPTKYPNMSRLVQSFVRSGWEYKFYTDSQAADFLSTHFPKEIREAYDALRPGAFKADLFRYCVLLIHGGVYADVDIQLESALDLSIAPDIGFMVPIDEPGKPVMHQMCLWNGFIAAAPGHTFLAKAIETIVNQVRNRFTSVDNDETFCEYHEDRDKIKSPELSVLHAYDTLFTAGPCLLGSSINRVLGRPGQSSFHPGEIKGVWDEKHRVKTREGTSFVIGIPEDSQADHYNQARIPGRTIILHQNKWDMGAHRFTLLEENLVIAATDLPDSNDLHKESDEDLDSTSNKDDAQTSTTKHEHYSKTHAKTGIYGVEHLYTNRNIVYEDIRIYVDATRQAKSFMKTSEVLSLI